MRNSFIKSLMEIARKDTSIFIITGDAGFGVFDGYRSLMPDRFINAGVAEANMIGFAAGMSLAGFNIFVYNIIPFILYRCYEQVRNDICYQRLPISLVGIGSGLTYAPSGMTHYGTEDIAIASTLPNLAVISPVDPVETKAAVQFAVRHNGPVYIRIAKTGEPVIRAENKVDITQPAVISEGEKIAIISYGSIVAECLEALELLKAKAINPRLISIPMLRPFPKESLYLLLRDIKYVFVVEEHLRTGGLASRMSEFILEHKLDIELYLKTLPDEFIHDIRNQAGMRKHYGLSSQKIAEAVKQIWMEL
jgi:transketolase